MIYVTNRLIYDTIMLKEKNLCNFIFCQVNLWILYWKFIYVKDKKIFEYDIANVSLKDEKYGLFERIGGKDHLSLFTRDLSIKEEGIKNIKIASILNSKEVKIIDKPKDIKKLVDFFNSMHLIEIQQEEVTNSQFNISIQYKNQKLNFIMAKDKFKDGSRWYKMKGKDLENFKKLYNSLNYESIK